MSSTGLSTDSQSKYGRLHKSRRSSYAKGGVQLARLHACAGMWFRSTRFRLRPSLCGRHSVAVADRQIGTTIARASFKQYMGVDKMTKAQQTSNTTNLTAVFGGCAFFGALSAWPSML